MFPLMKLPAKLLQNVVEHTRREELCILCHASKTLSQVATPVLYGDICCTQVREGDNKATGCLLHTLLLRPDLARMVKRIHLRMQSGTDTIIVPKLIESALPDLPEPWLPGPSRQRLEKMFMVIISLLFSLRSLTIDLEFEDTIEFFGALLKRNLLTDPQASIFEFRTPVRPYMSRAACFIRNHVSERTLSLPDFRFLERFDGPHEVRISQPTTMESLVMPFYLQSIQVLSMIVSGPTEVRWYGQRPCAENLTRLTLFHATISETMLRELLLATPRLQALECSFHWDPEEEGYRSVHLDCDQLRWALEPVQATLQRLKLNLNMCAIILRGEEVPLRTWRLKSDMGSLTQFGHLQHLELPWLLLLGRPSLSTSKLGDVLPKNLEYIAFSDDFADFFEGIRWSPQACLDRVLPYLRNVRIYTPSLKALEVKIDSHYNQWDNESKLELCRAGDNAGVTCSICPYESGVW